MKPEELEAILTRLDKLERRERWLSIERLVMLAVIGSLLATGPAARLLVTTAAPLEAGQRNARSIIAQSLAGLRRLLQVQPALDPRTVIEDQREAFGEPVPTPALTKPLAVPASASNSRPAAPRSGAPDNLKSVASAPAPLTRTHGPVTATASITASIRNPEHVSRAASKRRLTPSPLAAANASLAAAGLAVSRDVERSLAPLPVDESFQALALAGWPDSGAILSATRGTAPAPASILPSLPKIAASSPSTDEAASPPATASAPVTLKALGYAEAADGSAQIVLSDGNALYVVNEGQEFLDRFRVVSLRPEGVDVEDRLTNQSIHLSFGP